MTKEKTTADTNKVQTVDEYQEMYLVLINHEEQHSLWPSYKPIPDGWKQVFGEDIKEKCLEYVEEHWTDMRPLSLRKQMEELQKNNSK
jgi:MbtH protein